MSYYMVIQLLSTYSKLSHSSSSSPSLSSSVTTAPPPRHHPWLPQPVPIPIQTPFKLSTGVILDVLITTFCLTFFFLIYIKHCYDTNTNTLNVTTYSRPSPRDVLESFLVFRFGSLRGKKNGLDCAVYLTRFEDPEVLRLLPKCKHAFHVECVDTWLYSHSTCPLCRYKVEPDDVSLL